MLSRRRAIALCLLVALIGTLTMIVAIARLRAQLPVAREQRAIAVLVKAGAGVQLVNQGNGVKYFFVSLATCEDFESNDELLRYVPDIENVGILWLADLPLREAGRKSLFRLKGLATLCVYETDTSLSHEAYVGLKREMKLRYPDIFMVAGDRDRKGVE